MQIRKNSKRNMQEAIKMELTGKLNGILANVDKNAELLGVGLEAFKRKDQIIREIGKIATGHLHFPDMQMFGDNLKEEPDFKLGVAGFIGGYIVESLDLHPIATRLGSIVKKGSLAVALVTVVENLLGYATNPGYPEGKGSGNNVPIVAPGYY